MSHIKFHNIKLQCKVLKFAALWNLLCWVPRCGIIQFEIIFSNLPRFLSNTVHSHAALRGFLLLLFLYFVFLRVLLDQHNTVRPISRQDVGITSQVRTYRTNKVTTLNTRQRPSIDILPKGWTKKKVLVQRRFTVTSVIDRGRSTVTFRLNTVLGMDTARTWALAMAAMQRF